MHISVRLRAHYNAVDIKYSVIFMSFFGNVRIGMRGRTIRKHKHIL